MSVPVGVAPGTAGFIVIDTWFLDPIVCFSGLHVVHHHSFGTYLLILLPVALFYGLVFSAEASSRSNHVNGVVWFFSLETPPGTAALPLYPQQY